MSDLLQFIRFKDLDNWSVGSNLLSVALETQYHQVKLSDILIDLTNDRKIGWSMAKL